MAKSGFRGLSELALDAKGRLTVPVRYRELLAEHAAGQPLVVVKHPDKCLLVFGEANYEVFLDEMAKTSVLKREQDRYFVAGCCDVELDSASRLLIPPELRSFARIEKDVLLLGMRSHFELWDVRTHAEHEAGVQQQLSSALANLTF